MVVENSCDQTTDEFIFLSGDVLTSTDSAENKYNDSAPLPNPQLHFLSLIGYTHWAMGLYGLDYM